MKSVLDVEVSCFASYSSKEPKPVNLLTWLRSDKYADKVIALRSMEDKGARDRIKATLPAITVSGLFHSQRKAEFLIQHSGLICIDIDPKGNEHISNYNLLKEQLFHIEHVAYAGLSASGKGFFLIIPIEYPIYHTYHYKALQADFKSMGIAIDTAPKSVASLRGYSYDPNALFRHEALSYGSRVSNTTASLLKKEREYIRSVSKELSYTLYPHSTTKQRVEAVIQQIVQRQIDITSNETDWFRISCALANEFGEAGRGYYHSFSQFHPNYNYRETDRKYDNALKGGYHRIGIGSFFRIAQQYVQFL